MAAQELVSLVAFHPRFARWHTLAASVTEGTQVSSHYEAHVREWMFLPCFAVVQTRRHAASQSS